MKAKLNQEIKEYCKLLKLKGIEENFETLMEESKDYEEYLHKLLSLEIKEAEIRMRNNRIRAAKFPYRKYLEDLELDNLPKGMRKNYLNLPLLILLKTVKT